MILKWSVISRQVLILVECLLLAGLTVEVKRISTHCTTGKRMHGNPLCGCTDVKLCLLATYTCNELILKRTNTCDVGFSLHNILHVTFNLFFTAYNVRPSCFMFWYIYERTRYIVQLPVMYVEACIHVCLYRLWPSSDIKWRSGHVDQITDIFLCP